MRLCLCMCACAFVVRVRVYVRACMRICLHPPWNQRKMEPPRSPARPPPPTPPHQGHGGCTLQQAPSPAARPPPRTEAGRLHLQLRQLGFQGVDGGGLICCLFIRLLLCLVQVVTVLRRQNLEMLSLALQNDVCLKCIPFFCFRFRLTNEYICNAGAEVQRGWGLRL